MKDGKDGLGTPLWLSKCKEAEKELDRAQLFAKVAEAEAAIFTRLQEMGDDSIAERQAIEESTRTLRRIQVTRLDYPKLDGEN